MAGVGLNGPNPAFGLLILRRVRLPPSHEASADRRSLGAGGQPDREDSDETHHSHRRCRCAGSRVVAGACNRANDPTKTTETALKESNLGAVKVDWDKEAHVAHLKGTVDTVSERERAEQVATAAVGTSGKVLNEVTVKGMNDKNADDMD